VSVADKFATGEGVGAFANLITRYSYYWHRLITVGHCGSGVLVFAGCSHHSRLDSTASRILSCVRFSCGCFTGHFACRRLARQYLGSLLLQNVKNGGCGLQFTSRPRSSTSSVFLQASSESTSRHVLAAPCVYSHYNLRVCASCSVDCSMILVCRSEAASAVAVACVCSPAVFANGALGARRRSSNFHCGGRGRVGVSVFLPS